jgi:hypothetical protein
MKQRISHGATVDATTPDEVARIIAAAFDTRQDYDYHREVGAINLDGTGAGSQARHLTRQYAWLCERIAVTAGANALITLYHNQQQGTDLVEVIQLGAAGMYSDSFANNLYVPAGSRLLIVCSGGAANGQMTYNIQARLIQVAE